jgi:DNA polymerase-3 subunit delta'
MVRDRFAGLIGQDTAIALLCRAIQQGRIAPAYLFAGPSGIGRRLAAERFAEILFAGGEPSAPANGHTSSLRRRIQQRNHPDLLWVEPTYLQQGHW